MTCNKHRYTQIGLPGEQIFTGVNRVYLGVPLNEVEDIIMENDIFICVDSFLQHVGHLCHKKGIVIFGQSDPALFGYPENINLLKDTKYLRPHQFASWGETTYNEECFVPPEEVVDAIERLEHEKANSCV